MSKPRIKDDKKEEQIKQELTEEEVKGVDGGTSFHRGVDGAGCPNPDL